MTPISSRLLASVPGLSALPLVVARPADTIVGYTGAAVHTAFGGVFNNYNQLLTCLQYVGLRRVRDAAAPGNLMQRAAWPLFATNGIRINSIVGKGNSTPAQIQNALNELNQRYATNTLCSLEGPNEWNLTGGGGGYAGWEVDDRVVATEYLERHARRFFVC